MILFDTNILIDIYKQNSAVSGCVDRIGHTNIAISDVTCAELFMGARDKRELQRLRKNVSKLMFLPIQPWISAKSLSLLVDYRLSHGLDYHDALIAATAIHHNIQLFTHNLKDFRFIPELHLYHP